MKQLKSLCALLLGLVLIAGLLGACGDLTAGPGGAVTPLPTVTAAGTVVGDEGGDDRTPITGTVTATPTVSGTVAVTPTVTPGLTPTPTISGTLTPTPTVTGTLTPTPTISGTLTPTPTVTGTVTATPTVSTTVACVGAGEIEGIADAASDGSVTVNGQTYTYDSSVLVGNGKTPQAGGQVHVSVRCENGQPVVVKVIAQGPKTDKGNQGNGNSGGSHGNSGGNGNGNSGGSHGNSGGGNANSGGNSNSGGSHGSSGGGNGNSGGNKGGNSGGGNGGGSKPHK